MPISDALPLEAVVQPQPVVLGFSLEHRRSQDFTCGRAFSFFLRSDDPCQSSSSLGLHTLLTNNHSRLPILPTQ